MRAARVRSRLLATTCLVLGAVVWVYFAPVQIGGATQYVATDGISMEPRFHTGDLAIVRPAALYRVGDIVAYHSSLLKVVVLHRIIGRAGAHYIFKGDNNHFVDPTQPVRAQLVGKLWLHVAHGGAVLRWLHTPLHGGLIAAVFGVLALLGAREGRRRHRRRRMNPAGARGSSSRQPVQDRLGPGALTTIATAAAIGAALCLVLGLIAFSRPLRRPGSTRVAYSQQLRFGYHATAPAGAVYPTGAVNTGDPIFLSLVHRLRFTLAYRLTTAASHDLRGSEQVFLTVTASSGWTRRLQLGPLQHFRGPAFRTQAVLDLPAVASLVNRVQQLTHGPGASYTIGIAPQVHVDGVLAGAPLATSYAPALNFQMTASQLMPAAAASQVAAGQPGASLAPRQTDAVALPASIANSVAVLGHALSIAALRLAAVFGLMLSGAVAAVALVRRRLAPSDEAAHIRAQYGHLIVPVVLGPDGLGGAPVDVPTITALARLAESGQRLILHSRDHSRDTYLVKDEDALYRYQADPGNVTWGEWSATGPRPLAHVAAVTGRPGPSPRPATVTPATVTPATATYATATPATAPAQGPPEVFPPPAFLTQAAPEPPTEIRPAAALSGARASGPRPRLNRWLQTQSERARTVRALSSAILGTERH